MLEADQGQRTWVLDSAGSAEQAVCISVGEEEGHRDLGLFNDVPVGCQ